MHVGKYQICCRNIISDKVKKSLRQGHVKMENRFMHIGERMVLLCEIDGQIRSRTVQRPCMKH